SPDNGWLVAGGDFGNLWIWDVATAKLRKKIAGLGATVYYLAVSPDGAHIAETGYFGNAVRMGVSDAASGQVVYSEPGAALAYSPNGEWLACSQADDKTLVLMDTRTRQPVVRLPGHTEVIMAAIFSPDSRRIATCSRDRTVRVWDIATQQCKVLRGHTD